MLHLEFQDFRLSHLQFRRFSSHFSGFSFPFPRFVRSAVPTLRPAGSETPLLPMAMAKTLLFPRWLQSSALLLLRATVRPCLGPPPCLPASAVRSDKRGLDVAACLPPQTEGDLRALPRLHNGFGRTEAQRCLVTQPLPTELFSSAPLLHAAIFLFFGGGGGR